MSDKSIAINYYKILGVQQKSTTQQICAAYKEIALKFHPNLDHINKNQAYQIFSQSSQAFDILYDGKFTLNQAQKRSIYDQYGARRLKQGIIKDGELIGKYKITSEPEQIFQRFFGSRNVYDHLLEVGEHQGYSHPIFRNQYPKEEFAHKIQDLQVKVPCTLTELYNGCIKELKYSKRVTLANGQSCSYVTEKKQIQIEPGMSQNTPIIYDEQGHNQPGHKQSKLIFKIQEIPEKNYTRSDQNNLIYTAKISLMDALESKSITIIQLDGNTIQLHFDEIISPQTQRLIEGKGMPKLKASGRGDLLVRFDIQFPEEIEMNKKTRIIQLLQNEQNM